AVAPPAQILSPLSSRVEPTCALVVARREPRTASWVQEPSEPRRNTNTAPFWTSRPGALTATRAPSTGIADPNRSPQGISADGRVPASTQRPPVLRNTSTEPPVRPPGAPTKAESPAMATAAPKVPGAMGTPPSEPASVQA